MKYRRTATLASALGLAVLSVGGWIGYQLWQFHAEDSLRAGVTALKNGDYAVAREKLLPLARNGDRHAERLAAYVYAFGAGVPVDDVKAEIWARRSECGCSTPGEVEYDIAFDYLDGTLDRQGDASQAVAWLRRAAEAGHPEAERLLANSEQSSAKGFHVDPQVARYWRQFLAGDGSSSN